MKSFWNNLKSFFSRKAHIIPEIKLGLHSINYLEVKAAKRLIRAINQVPISSEEQRSIYKVYQWYNLEKQRLQDTLPHLPKILQEELANLRTERNKQWQEILGNEQFQRFIWHFKRSGKSKLY